MELTTLYETYKTLSGPYEQHLEILANQEVIKQSPDTFSYLINTKDKLEEMMNRVSELEVNEENKENLQDFKYLLSNSYFLSVDVSHFYEYQQEGRLKLRILNYLNNKRRDEMFGH